MKLDELMAGLEEFLNAPPAKRQKVQMQFSYITYFVLKIDLNFSDEPQTEENEEEISDSDITDASDSEENSSDSE